MGLEDDTPGGVAMVTTHGHHLSAGVVEDDHIVLEGGHLLGRRGTGLSATDE